VVSSYEAPPAPSKNKKKRTKKKQKKTKNTKEDSEEEVIKVEEAPVKRFEVIRSVNNWPRNPRPNKSLLNKLSRLLNPLSYLKNQKQIPIAYYSRR
jgi:hypothetical protein